MLGCSLCRLTPAIMSPLILLWTTLTSIAIGIRGEPEFSEPVENVTIPVDRDASLSCIVDHLEDFRVAWFKVDTQTILTIHTHVITHNSRVSTSHNGHRQWNLHIKNIKEADRGFYMCQINTSPMKSQVGYIEVVVPPDIMWDETTSDVTVTEGQSVSLDCRATGYPKPNITWRREDGEPIVMRLGPREKVRVQTIESDRLNISRVSRRHMGSYLCIASNGVPPAVSKRVKLQVSFAPVIKVLNQLVGAPFGKDVSLECYVEASPTAVNYWTRESGEMLINSFKYNVSEIVTSYKVFMKLIIKDLMVKDFGDYKCVSKNSLGEAEESIRLRELDVSPSGVHLGFEDRAEGHMISNDSYSIQKSVDSLHSHGSNIDQSFQGRKYGLRDGNRGRIHNPSNAPSNSRDAPSSSTTTSRTMVNVALLVFGTLQFRSNQISNITYKQT